MSGRREQDYRTSPPDADAARQWNSLSNLQRAYRELWDVNLKHKDLAEKNGNECNRLRTECDRHKARAQDLDLDNASLANKVDVLRDENLRFQDEIARLQNEVNRLKVDLEEHAHLRGKYENLKLKYDELKPPSSGSTSSKHHKSSSTSSKKDKGKDKESTREKERPREKRDRDRERDRDPDSVEHLRERFQHKGGESSRPPVAQQMPTRTRRLSFVDAGRPQVHVAVPVQPMYEQNYQIAPGLASPATPGYPSQHVPRGGARPTVTVEYPGGPDVQDGNYRPAPLPSQGSSRR